MKPIRWILVALIAILFVFSACAGTRTSIVGLTESDMKNVETMRTVAKNLLKTWPMYSGIIRGAMGDRLSELPQRAIDAMDELDRWATLQAEGPIANDLGDMTLGRSLGLRVNLLASSVKVALEMFAPDILAMLPMIML